MKGQILSSFRQRLEGRKIRILGEADFKKYAVMLPLIERRGQTHILFEVRSQTLRRKPGEICFPGGRMDRKDRDEEFTAIRETCEELGIPEDQIDVIAPLDYVVTPYSSIIHPFVGIVDKDVIIDFNPDEVDEVFEVPLDFFLSHTPAEHDVQLQSQPERNFPVDLLPGGENYHWRRGKVPQYFYQYEDYVIWGLTARILRHFIQLIDPK